MNLEEELKEYKALTLDIMEQINIDGNISYLLESRERVLNKIKSYRYNIDELRNYARLLRIVELDDEMNRLVKIELVNIKKKINTLKKRQKVNQQYLYSVQTRFSRQSFDKKY